MSKTTVEDQVDGPPQLREKVGKVPTGIETKEVAVNLKKGKTAIFLFDQEIHSDAPRNVYRETITDKNGSTLEWIWWHCEDSKYIGRKEILKKKDRFSTRLLLKGYEYNIPVTEANLKKVIDLATPRTKFYRKRDRDVAMMKGKEEFL